MIAVGIVEFIAGIVVAVKPKFGAWIVAFWLWGIIINLLLVPDITMSHCATWGCRLALLPWPG